MKVKLVSLTKSLVEEKELSAEELIVYVARVSNPSNQLNSETSDKLIAYMVKNKHWSPFEMCDMTVEIVTSRGIAQQILRHRSFSFQEFCIAGDSKIRLIQPNGATYTRTIKHLYNLQQKPNQYIKNNGLPYARIFDGEKFTKAKIKEVFNTGFKDCFEITLADGKKLKTTKEHKFLTKNGYDTLENIIGLNINKTKANMSKVSIIATNGVLNYQQKEWLNNQKKISIQNKTGVQGIADVAGVSYHTIRKWLRINKLTFTKNETAQYTDVWNKGKFGYKKKPHTLETINKMKISAKKGKENNLWRGGSNRSERLKIADWCNANRSEFLINANYKCVNCGSSKKLELDHIVPVYKDISLAYEKTNIQVLCKECHNNKHSINGDRKIWKEKSRGNQLVVKWQKIINIEYIGKIQTYDIEIDHSTHNYVANGIVTHNSQRYAEVTDFEAVQLRKSGTTNRQSSSEVFDPIIDGNIEASRLIENHLKESEDLYKSLLSAGVAKECARFVLPLTTQTKIYMKGSIRSWLTYLNIRLDTHTQLEHRQIAVEIADIFTAQFPNITRALNNFNDNNGMFI